MDSKRSPSGGLPVAEEKDPLAIPGELSETGLTLPENLSYEGWRECGFVLKRIDQSVKWWIGDWLNFGEERFPERWSQAVEATEYDQETLRKAAWVAKSVPRGTRRESLPYRHHEVVASLSPREQERWLDESEPEQPGDNPRYSSRELREAIKASGVPANTQKVTETRACPTCGGSGEVPVD